MTRAVVLLVAFAAIACSAEPDAPPTGLLWEHRDRLAAALQVRHGQLAVSARKTARPCVQYWITGKEVDALDTLDACELRRRRVRADFARYLGRPVNDADVRDARFWRYVAEHARL